MGFGLGRTLKKAGGFASGLLFGSGGKPTNPYVAPNVDFLRDPAPKGDYQFLTKGFRGQDSFYQPPTERSGGAFQSYIGAINAPSSVDQVRSGMNTEQMNLLLDQIGRDTTQKYGSELSKRFGMGDFAAGIGPTSDIAGNSLAQVAAEGARTAAGARLNYGLADLERLGAREADARGAYGQQYEAAVGADTQMRELSARAAAGDQAAYNQLLTLRAQGVQTDADREAARRAELARVLTNQAGGSASAYRQGDYGLIGDFGKSFANKGGETLGYAAFR